MEDRQAVSKNHVLHPLSATWLAVSLDNTSTHNIREEWLFSRCFVQRWVGDIYILVAVWQSRPEFAIQNMKKLVIDGMNVLVRLQHYVDLQGTTNHLVTRHRFQSWFSCAETRSKVKMVMSIKCQSIDKSLGNADA